MEACPRWERTEVCVPEWERGKLSRKREADAPLERHHREPRYAERRMPGSGRRGWKRPLRYLKRLNAPTSYFHPFGATALSRSLNTTFEGTGTPSPPLRRPSSWLSASLSPPLTAGPAPARNRPVRDGCSSRSPRGGRRVVRTRRCRSAAARARTRVASFAFARPRSLPTCPAAP